jgi:hypothetical protein
MHIRPAETKSIAVSRRPIQNHAAWQVSIFTALVIALMLFCQQHANAAGLADRVEFRLCDYRDVTGTFDRVSSIGMMEHVGIGDDHHVGYRSPSAADPWRRTDPLLLDAARVARFTPEILREIDDAVAFAESSPWPGPESLLADVA